MKRIVIGIILLSILSLSVSAAEINYPKGYVPYYNEQNAVALAKLVWAEARGIPSDMEKAAVMWCVINRVEREGCWANSIMEVIKQPKQFAYYKNSPLDPQLYELAKDVLIRWDMERCGYSNVGRVLPAEYCWFTGYGGKNWFRPAFQSALRWNWSLPNPYAS